MLSGVFSSSHRGPGKPAFTLIELLIVIAIIAILALIAVPNFLEAQVRAKVSRVKADYRSLATGIEAYCVDWGGYPWFEDPVFSAQNPQYSDISYRLWALTTPVAYVTTVDMRDPFIDKGTLGDYTDGLVRYCYNYRTYQYTEDLTGDSAQLNRKPIWILNSLGPDRVKSQGLNVELLARNIGTKNQTVIYDPTNGTVSAGDIPRTGGETQYKNN